MTKFVIIAMADMITQEQDCFCDCDVPVGKYGYCTNKNVPTGMIHHVLRVLE